MVVSLSNLTGTSAAALPMSLLNFRAIGKVQTRISWLRDFTRSCSKTPYRLVNRGPVEMSWLLLRQWLWTKTSLSDLIFLSFLQKLWPAILDKVIEYIVIKICHCVTIKTYIFLFCERVNFTQKFSQLTCYPPAVLSAGFDDDNDSLRGCFLNRTRGLQKEKIHTAFPAVVFTAWYDFFCIQLATKIPAHITINTVSRCEIKF